MATNGNKKGSRGEREFCDHLEECGAGEWRRAQQYQGVNVEATGDIVPEEGDEVAEAFGRLMRFEVKRYKKNFKTYSKQMQDWLRQARDETPEPKLAVIAFRYNHAKWDLVLSAGGMSVRTRATRGNVQRLYTLLSKEANVRDGQLTLTEMMYEQAEENEQESPAESGGVPPASKVLRESAARIREIAGRIETEGNAS